MKNEEKPKAPRKLSLKVKTLEVKAAPCDTALTERLDPYCCGMQDTSSCASKVAAVAYF